MLMRIVLTAGLMALNLLPVVWGIEPSTQQAQGLSVAYVRRGERLNLAPYVKVLDVPQRSADQRPWEDGSLPWRPSGFSSENCDDDCFVEFSPRERPVWLRIDFAGSDARENEWIIELDHPITHEVNFFLVKDGRVLREVIGGAGRGFYSREIPHRSFAWPLIAGQGEQYSVYLFLNTPGMLKVPLYLYDQEHFFTRQTQINLFYGIYFGAVLAILLYNLFLFLKLKDINYLYYILYGLGFLYFMAGFSGLGQQYLWPGTIWLQVNFFPLSIGLTYFFLPIFLGRFLEIFRQSRIFSWFIYLQCSLTLLAMVLAFFLPLRTGFLLTYAVIITGVITSLSVIIRGVLKKSRSAKILLYAFSALLLVSIIMIMRIFKLLPANFFLDNSLYFGSLAELLLLSFALADRFEQVELNRQIAEEKARSRALFFSAIGHDLRQPLGVILGYAEHLRRNPNDKEAAEIIQKIADSAHALETILQDVMDFDRLESGRMVAQLSELDIDRDLFLPLQNIFISKAQQKGLSIIFENDAPRRYVADVPRLLRILMNLVSNAVKYTEQGGILVSFCEREQNGQIYGEFSIRDSGIGMHSDELALIFQEYVRVGKYSNDLKSGVGLGLTIVKKLVDFMKGEIKVESEPGRGSIFTLRIPLKPFDDYYREQQQAVEKTKDLKGLTVIAIDDDPDQLQLLQRVTAPWNLKLTAATNCNEAKALFEQHNFRCDAALIDWHIGNRTGLMVAEEIWKMRPGLPVIFLTGEESLAGRVFPVEVRSVIAKPIRLEVLYRELWGLSLAKRP